LEKILSCENITKSFEGKTVLFGVELSVSFGEKIAVCGKSGAGKTTLLSILGALEKADGGKVFFCGKEIKRRDMREYRRKNVGFLFQGSCLIDEYTAKQNVESAIRISRSGEDAVKYLEMVGLADKADAYPLKLSGGEGRRVALARALAKKPKLLLLDEPTEGLDRETALGIIELTEKLCKENNVTMIMVTHDKEIAGRMDRVLNLQNGCLTEAVGEL